MTVKDCNTSDWSILHFAPESFLKQYFLKLTNNYMTADLVSKNVDINCDLQNLPFNNKFDFIYASHVLEHIQDDISAIKEIERILKPGGIAILPVPIVRKLTIEYQESNPAESGHFRAPGIDYFDKYKEFFSRVEVYTISDLADIHQTYIYETPNNNNITFIDNHKSGNQIKYKDYVPVCIS